MNNRLFVILSLADSALSTAAVILQNIDADDAGIDDETAAALRLAHERIQAYLLRQSTAPPK